jgi:hypothetical protein
MKKDIEHSLQVCCVHWFRIQYPEYATLLFAVPNGGARNAITGARLKDEGVIAGVADLILLLPHREHGVDVWHGLAIEMKTPTGRQSPEQRAWQAAIEAQGYKYAIARDVLGFVKIIQEYLNKTR